MKFVLKAILVLLILGAVYGAGYFSGGTERVKLTRLLDTVKLETKAKVAALEGEVRSLRFRMHLITARDRLLAARSNLDARNFGTAEKDLNSAQADLRAAMKWTLPETAPRLAGIEQSVEGVIEIVRRSDSRAGARLDGVKTDLDRLIERS